VDLVFADREVKVQEGAAVLFLADHLADIVRGLLRIDEVERQRRPHGLPQVPLSDAPDPGGTAAEVVTLQGAGDGFLDLRVLLRGRWRAAARGCPHGGDGGGGGSAAAQGIPRECPSADGNRKAGRAAQIGSAFGGGQHACPCSERKGAAGGAGASKRKRGCHGSHGRFSGLDRSMTEGYFPK